MKKTTPYADCTDLIINRNRLVDFANENGYLFFQNLLPTDLVSQLRHQVLKVAESHELLDDSVPIDDGVCRNGVFIYEGDGTLEYNAFYADIQKLRLFHSLPHHSCIIRIMEMLFDDSVFVHPRHICHIMFPGNTQNTTPPHQDFHPVRGSRNTWTAWTPLGDCDEALGGLTVAPRSKHLGLLVDPDVRSGKAIESDTEWAWNPFKSGDVLMFHSLTIHRGRDNHSADRIRLATSARYQPIGEPVDEAALGVHLGCAKWDDLYANLHANDPLKYYWKALNLNIQPSFHRKAKSST
ncbi:MAG: phytanoyl-CoA dioxygenase family protein [Candidatus Latescibacterota bacterium]|nr:phytanoyl-CoA dioxygenase family protein [Candidatus Latescibacterota bacterium]